MRIISIALLASSTGIFSLITLSIIFAKIPEFPTLPELVKKRIDAYFNNINQIYIKKGFWWRIAPELLYIEMIIDDKLPPDLKYEHPDIDFDNDPNSSNIEERKAAKLRMKEEPEGKNGASSTRRSKKNKK